MNSRKYAQFAALIIVVVIIALVVKHPKTSDQAAPVQTGTTNELVNIVAYSCDAGKTISATYYQDEGKASALPDQPPIPGGSVALTLSDGRTMTLGQTISADGTRYANPDESFVFWSKGNGALVLENNVEKSYIGCIRVTSVPGGSTLTQIYSNSEDEFSIRLPADYKADPTYKYQALGPGKDIYGVKFTIPGATATGTNLSNDSYISVEEIPQTASCSASIFLSTGSSVKNVTEEDTTYSVGTSSDAGAGNRYDETVYAIPGTNPCVAVRYFIHYGAIGNYPAGAVKEFDESALIAQFDQIRKTLIINQ